MKKVLPERLRTGDEVRVIAPSHSLGIIADDIQVIATSALSSLGLSVTFGAHAREKDDFHSSSIEARLLDLHEAFLDKNVKAIFAVIGGYNVNQLLPHLNWKIIRENPKAIVGYSDITALQNAIFAKTGLVTYSGPAYSTLGQRHHAAYTLKHLEQCLMTDAPIILEPSKEWLDDEWYIKQDDRTPIPNEGWEVLRAGKGTGTLIGGNLNTLRLLQGTEYFPSLEGAILFLEDDDASFYADFDRQLESLAQTEGFSNLRGLLLGRFQKKSEMTNENLRRLVSIRADRLPFPIIANLDFGHTNPMVTLPIGGEADINASEREAAVKITLH